MTIFGRAGRRRTRPKPSAVVLLSRPGCALCAAAQPMVERTAAEAGVSFAVQNIDDDPTLRAQWTDKVPVVLLDGAEHAYWRIREKALRRALHLPDAPSV